MKYTIECAFGEIVDKITILQIKLKKSSNASQTEHISYELNGLEKYMKPADDLFFHDSFSKLKVVNEKLWFLEDTIRMKSQSGDFGVEYIMCAEEIHKTNDLRYHLKKAMNEKYDSGVLEVKIYSNLDYELYVTAIRLFETGNYQQSKVMLHSLCQKYISTPEINEFIIELFFSYYVNISRFNEPNIYENKLHALSKVAHIYIKDDAKIENVFNIYASFLLKKKEYVRAGEYIKYMQPVKVKHRQICPDTMSYFKADDTNSTLLIYSSGGLGDKVMFSRFIRRICESNVQKQNHVYYLIDDSLYWMYEYAYKDIKNLTLFRFSDRSRLPPFVHHTSLTKLYYYLGLDYENIYTDYYLENFPSSGIRLDTVLDVSKNINIGINWHGSSANPHEKTNRGIDLKQMCRIFKSFPDINWICLQPEVCAEDMQLLKTHNVKIITPLDTKGNSFQDTLTIMKELDLVISTDTSLVHVAGTANIPCWTLLTIGCDWRWTTDISTNWYPNMKLYRQEQFMDWSKPIDRMIEDLKPLINI